MRVQAASCVAVWIAAIQIEPEGFHRLAASCVFCILASTSDPAGPVHLDLWSNGDVPRPTGGRWMMWLSLDG